MIPRKKLLKAFGITRKTLDHYNDIKLLCPINTDEIVAAKELGFKPEWQYEDDAMQKLQLIQIFRALDYEPAEIKKFFDESEYILDDAMTKLLAKKKEIDGMINIVKMLQATASIPQSAARAIEKMNVEYLWAGKNYSEQLSELKTVMADSTMFEESESEWMVPLLQLLFSVIGYKDKAPSSDEVQIVLWEAYKFFINIFLEEEGDQEIIDHIDEVIHEPELIDSFCEMSEGIMADALKDEFVARYGEDTLSFFVEAVRFFKTTQANHNSDL